MIPWPRFLLVYTLAFALAVAAGWLLVFAVAYAPAQIRGVLLTGGTLVLAFTVFEVVFAMGLRASLGWVFWVVGLFALGCALAAVLALVAAGLVTPLQAYWISYVPVFALGIPVTRWLCEPRK